MFGWTYQEIPEMDYTIFNSGEGGIGGGMMKRSEQSPPHPVNYMQCDDLDATIERVTNNGGTIVVPKMEVGDVGWMARHRGQPDRPLAGQGRPVADVSGPAGCATAPTPDPSWP